jgi:serpin B
LHRSLPAAGNLFHSPLSVWTALAMLADGAQGETRVELERALGMQRSAGGLKRADDPTATGVRDLAARLAAMGEGAVLRQADAVWVDRAFGVNPATLKALQDRFGATVAALDLRGAPEASRGEINRWVKEQTRDKIEDLLPEGALTPQSRLVLTDAVHFLGRWRSPFAPKLTRSAHFRRADGSTVAVPFMHVEEAIPVREAAFDAEGAPRDPWQSGKGGTTWLELPYEGDTAAFLAVMPDEPDGLPALERSLDAEVLAARTAALKSSRLMLRVPRFKLASRCDLVAPLQSLGVESAFDASRADLSAFAAPDEPEGRSLYATGAFHAATIAVDDQGTEAAAATGIVVGVRSAPRFVSLERPFLAFIRERETGAVLFMGRVTDPSA